jgi:hypothetical protein
VEIGKRRSIVFLVPTLFLSVDIPCEETALTKLFTGFWRFFDPDTKALSESTGDSFIR